jgi:hypothetical protein
MRQLGSVILAAVLLGIPRALEARAFGAERAVYLDVVTQGPELRALAEELGRAIEGTAYALAARPLGATLVVELLGVTQRSGQTGQRSETLMLAVRDGRRTRPMLVEYAPWRRAKAAHLVLESLRAFDA